MKFTRRQIVIGSIFFVLFLLLFFLSTFVKSYLNKNSEELLGRKIELGSLNLNYFRVSVRAGDLVVYEENQRDTFAGFKELYINFDPWKLTRNEYSFSAITLDSLYAYVIQDSSSFNFDDLIPAKDSSAIEIEDTLNSEPFQFSIYDIKLSRGKIDFYDQKIDNRLLMDNLNLNLPKIAWDSEQSEVGAEFEFGEKGSVFLGAEVNHQIKRYDIAIRMNNMELEPVSNYVKQYLNADGISGWFDANIRVNGHMENATDIIISGSTKVDTFKLWEPEGEDVLTWNQMSIAFDSLDLGRSSFNFSKIQLVEPKLVATLNKDMSNIEHLLLPLMITDSLAVDSMPETKADSVLLTFSVDSLLIDKAEVLFTDNTLNRPFKYDIKEIDVSLANIYESAEDVPVTFSLNLNDQGLMSGTSEFSIVDPLNVQLKAKVEKLRLMSFSPYTEYYITRPITHGDFNYDLSIEMSSQQMLNENKIKINELEFGDKTKDTTGINAPIRLGLYLLKDPNDIIAIDLPVEGNPSEPDFSVSRIIWKSFMNLLVKTAASPFNALANLVSTRPEELENIPMLYAQDTLAVDQKNTLDKIAQLLSKKPDLLFSFTQETHPEIEKDALALYLAKTQMLTDKFNPKTEDEIARYKERLNVLSDTDEAFLRFVSNNVNGSDTLSISKSCRQLIGQNELDEAFNKLIEDRSLLIQDYLLNECMVDSSSVEVMVSDLRNIPEELKSPNFNVEVSLK